MVKTCNICGKLIENAQRATKFCSECGKERRKKYLANYLKLNTENIRVASGDYALLARYARENNLKLIEAFHKIVVDSLEKA